MDCTISGFYAMAKVQLQVLRYNLEHLVDSEDEQEDIDTNDVNIGKLRYKDNTVIQSRLVHCVKHQLQIKW